MSEHLMGFDGEPKVIGRVGDPVLDSGFLHQLPEGIVNLHGVQLPPNFKADQVVLAEFLKCLPRPVRAGFEFRHDSWFNDATWDTLRERNIALCVAETEERNPPDVVTADYAYYRYRKPRYTADERKAMVGRMQEHLAAGRDVFAYFKHEETPEGALYAVDVLQAAGTSFR